MSRLTDFSDLLSTSTLSSLSTLPSLNDEPGGCSKCTFGAADGDNAPCGWLMPVIIGISVILLFVLAYYWMCGDDRKSKVDEVVIIQEGMSGGQIVDIDANIFRKKLSSRSPFVVVFVSDHCGWCKKLKAELAKASPKFKVPVHTLNAEKAGQNLLQQYKVSGFPHLIKFEGGQPKKVQSGFAPADTLIAFVNA